MLSPIRTKTVVITYDDATGVSTSANLEGGTVIGIIMPAAWTAAGLSFLVSPDDTTFYSVFAHAGEVTLATGTTRYVIADSTKLSNVYYIKIRSGTVALPVTQLLADRTLTIVYRKEE